MTEPAGLAPARRAAGLALAWTAVVAAGPGVLTRDGSAFLAVVGVALWGAVSSRPGRRAALLDALFAGLGWSVLVVWAAYVWVPLLLWLGPGYGLYQMGAGAVLRRLRRAGLSLAFALPLVWLGLETLRGLVPPPFGHEALQLGHHLHAHLWLAGSARVWGVGGLSWVLAAAAGLAAELASRRRLPAGAWVAGLAPLGLGVLLAFAIPAPASEPGPSVLLVQPAFAQERKQFGDPHENRRESIALTAAAVEAAETPPDLVCWGETMTGFALFDEELLDALRDGYRPPAWRSWLTERVVDAQRQVERRLFLEPLREILDGASILSGVETYQWTGERVRRGNSIVLWGPDGERSDPALKRFTVPGAESMLGLERFAFVRDGVHDIAGYVPDLEPGQRTGVIELTARSGREYAFGAAVCYDNAFLRPFTEAAREQPIDFHLVVSNEAWYGHSWEVDQMLAYSHLIAIATGRALVRATNSGISAVVGPDGAEVARLEAGGADRMVRGTLSAVVPVPRDREARTFYTRFEGPWLALWVIGPWAGLLATRRRARNRVATGG